MNWCRVCCTDHPVELQCPGELRVTGPEETSWKVTVETPRGLQGYGVLMAQAGRRWRARILTFPNVLWSVPGGGGTMKFLGRTSEEAERKAVSFIRAHCAGRNYLLHDELTPVLADSSETDASQSVPSDFTRTAQPRYQRRLPLRFGENKPTLRAQTKDLSTGGLFVTTDSPLPEGKLVGMTLELEYGKVPLRGAVAWLRRIPEAGRPPGMGVRLLNPPPMYVNYVQHLA